MLSQGLRDTDLRGRLGGDEFVAYLADSDQSAARQVAEGMLVALRTTSAALGPRMQTTASIGIVPGCSTAPDSGAMLTAADLAMYRAKRDGGDRVAVWDPPFPHETVIPRRSRANPSAVPASPPGRP